MRVCQMRARIKSVYPSKRWRSRVDKMQDEQVIAVYFNMLKEGKIK